MTGVRAILLSVFIVSGVPSIAARADAGHDHAAPAASGVVGASVSRVEAQSDLFEIVGVVEGDAMKIFLDRYATNEPVTDAKIDVEAGPLKGSAPANPDGTYTFRNAALTKPGQLPVTFTISAGGDSDLLAGELVIAESATATARADDAPLRKRWWWVAGGLLSVAAIALAWWSRRKRIEGSAR